MDAPVPNPEAAHDWGHFQYVRADIEQLARDEGWNVEYIGDWGHPRNQRMLRLTPA